MSRLSSVVPWQPPCWPLREAPHRLVNYQVSASILTSANVPPTFKASTILAQRPVCLLVLLPKHRSVSSRVDQSRPMLDSQARYRPMPVLTFASARVLASVLCSAWSYILLSVSFLVPATLVRNLQC